MSVMTIFYNPEYEKVSKLVSKYMIYDEDKKKFIIPKDAPKEVHEAYKRRQEIWEKYQEY